MPVHLLLIEDSPDDVFLLINHLKRNGYDVDYDLVQTINDLYDALTTSDYDIVISDYRLPTMNGLQALEIVKEHRPDLPFMLVSGTIGEERAVQVMKAGANDYIMKDNLTRLPNAIERELREYRERIARHKAETQVTRLTRALSQSASLIVLTNTKGIIEYVNETFTRVTGYTADEAIGRYTNLLKSGYQSEEIYQDLWNTIKTGKEWHGELLNRKKDGTLFWVSMSISAIRNPDGEVTDYVAVQEDITERKRMEAELQDYTERLEQMVKERTNELLATKDQMEVILYNSSDAMALATAEGDILMANPAFHELFGDNIDRSLEDMIALFDTEKDRSMIAEAILKSLHGGLNERRVVRFRDSKGEMRDLDLVFAPVKTDEVDASVISVRDITRIRDLERFKTEFVANAAHDLSNPIAALKTRLYMLKARPENLAEHMIILEALVARMKRLVTELRTLSQLDRGVIELDLQPSDINTIINDVIISQRPLADQKQLNLHFVATDDLPPALVDPDKIERVIVNLIGNAIHYTPASGDITMSTHLCSSGDMIQFTVADTGIGIEPENLPHIFERFFRTDMARDMSSEGTGLGLAIVKEMVEIHGGSISVTSEQGLGTKFVVCVPIARQSITSADNNGYQIQK